MPLGTEDRSLMEVLQNLPHDKDGTRRGEDVTYGTKVALYDSKCGKCGYKRVTVQDIVDDDDNPVEFEDINEAVIIGQKYGRSVIRECTYPNDVKVIHNKPIYPDVNEIVKNTCSFWKL